MVFFVRDRKRIGVFWSGIRGGFRRVTPVCIDDIYIYIYYNTMVVMIIIIVILMIMTPINISNHNTNNRKNHHNSKHSNHNIYRHQCCEWWYFGGESCFQRER